MPGCFPRVPFLEMTERDWDQVLDVNLKSSCFCAQYVAKAMVAAGRRGAIINIASGAALRASPRGVHYVASKGWRAVADPGDGAGARPVPHQG
jgi:NAD(P)-dependent dehydrogenase (short-subunit alcohol dehydrogenase family)